MSLSRFPDLLTRIEHGMAAEEIQALERLAETAPGHVTAHVALARAYELDSRWDAARRSWQRAHLLMPLSPAVRAGLERTAHHATDSADRAAAASPAETSSPEPASKKTDPAPSAQKGISEEVRGEPSDETSAGKKEELERPPGSFDDLDTLIEDLEGARIEPNPNPTDAPAPNLESDVHDMVTPTLARIYERQKQYAEAARVYRRLADEAPEEASEYRRKAEEMRTRAKEEDETRAGERKGKEEWEHGGAEGHGSPER